jgi:hypothetical protein
VPWIIPVVLLLACCGVVGYRRHAAKKDLGDIQRLMQGRIRLAFGKDAIVSETRTLSTVSRAWCEPGALAVRRPAGVV